MPIDIYSRKQSNLSIFELYPITDDGNCRCGCQQKPIYGQWASPTCEKKAIQNYRIIKGNVNVIRQALYERDNINGHIYCANDGCNKRVTQLVWEADHKKPVRYGGGGSDLDNYQIFCTKCHKEKTRNMYLK